MVVVPGTGGVRAGVVAGGSLVFCGGSAADWGDKVGNKRSLRISYSAYETQIETVDG